MKLICIDDVTDILKFGNGLKELTYGKEYKVLSIYSNTRPQVRIINDLGINNDYLMSRFVTQQEFRDMRINKLLNK